LLPGLSGGRSLRSAARLDSLLEARGPGRRSREASGVERRHLLLLASPAVSSGSQQPRRRAGMFPGPGSPRRRSLWAAARRDPRFLPRAAGVPLEDGDRLRRRLSLLRWDARVEPRDLLGREADGLLDSEHSRAHPGPASFRSVVRRRAAALLL